MATHVTLLSVCVCVCVCVRACMHACVRACVRACLFVCVGDFLLVHLLVCIICTDVFWLSHKTAHSLPMSVAQTLLARVAACPPWGCGWRVSPTSMSCMSMVSVGGCMSTLGVWLKGVTYQHELYEHGECRGLHVHTGGVAEVLTQVLECTSSFLKTPPCGVRPVSTTAVLLPWKQSYHSLLSLCHPSVFQQISQISYLYYNCN